MPTSNALRLQIESRFPAALSPAPRTVRETAPVGIAAIDNLLLGGLPVGAISEITGPPTSGRTALVLSFVAQRTGEGKVCAWIDASDALDPESAAASGVSLRQLLWVRCASKAEQAKGKAGSRLDQSRLDSSRLGRSRLDGSRPGGSRPGGSHLGWSHLDQAIRATDLVLQAGGFAAIVLDLGDIPEEFGRRIPLATWYRFRQAADQSRSCLVVVGNAGYAQSSAAVALDCLPLRAVEGSRTVLEAGVFDVRLKRQRDVSEMGAMRKPPVSTWTAETTWATGTKGRAAR